MCGGVHVRLFASYRNWTPLMLSNGKTITCPLKVRKLFSTLLVRTVLFFGITVSLIKIIHNSSNGENSSLDVSIQPVFKLQIFLLTNPLKPLKTFFVGYLSFIIFSLMKVFFSNKQNNVCMSRLFNIVHS